MGDKAAGGKTKRHHICAPANASHACRDPPQKRHYIFTKCTRAAEERILLLFQLVMIFAHLVR
ncbi:hypothetical protein [Pyruvatibacter mobilis]|jgi:hypothetical protein|uniref:hypothetical protein n=1 Tax=Pyruvatibacter mobilis TaxID=1712261 RepID=UPI003BB134C7